MSGDDDLAEGSAGVVADQRDVAKIEGREEVVDQLGNAIGREVGALVHRAIVRAEGEVGHDAAIVLGKLGDHLAPEVSVHEQPVYEHDRLA
jgi:hypothetical protein